MDTSLGHTSAETEATLSTRDSNMQRGQQSFVIISSSFAGWIECVGRRLRVIDGVRVSSLPYGEPVHITAVLLAAGAGSRFGGPTHKLLADLRGRPVWAHSLDHLLDAGFDDAVLLTGAAPIDDAAVHAVAAGRPVQIVHNPQWSTGQASSVRQAAQAAADHHAEAMVIGLADQPFVDPTAWRAVADADADCELVVATYDGRIGPNPVRIAADLWPELPSAGDEGARSLLRRHSDRVCSVQCLGSGNDIDTLEDLARWTSS